MSSCVDLIRYSGNLALVMCLFMQAKNGEYFQILLKETK